LDISFLVNFFVENLSKTGYKDGGWWELREVLSGTEKGAWIKGIWRDVGHCQQRRAPSALLSGDPDKIRKDIPVCTDNGRL
jgi:hypothetical protein